MVSPVSTVIMYKEKTASVEPKEVSLFLTTLRNQKNTFCTDFLRMLLLPELPLQFYNKKNYVQTGGSESERATKKDK